MGAISPEAFRPVLGQATDAVEIRLPEERFAFLKACNEWAEDNHLEPDIKDGGKYLDVIREEDRARETHGERASLGSQSAL